MDCLFCKIAQGELNTNFVYEDEDIVAFEDIAPQAPTHILCIPRKHISTVNDLNEVDAALTGKLSLVASKIAKQRGLANSGYRLVMNCNEHGGQTVFHIHLHLLAGRAMSWPPG
ncbi:MAG: histidine triad nucleotide-binding protein [Gammaproteobacteria bacterium]|nr:histidine triad nucleotide-binding protein [Gammaproteobacteria bacterium]MDH5778072.1 histidine triad nucleotide-binding protein [Gammaproteobacteria bacterium]